MFGRRFFPGGNKTASLVNGTPRRLSARAARAVPVPEHRPGTDHWPFPFQRRRLRRGGRHPDCRDRCRYPRETGTARADALVVLLPVSVLDRLLRGPTV